MTESQLQDLLSAFTDALLHDEAEAEHLLEQSVLPRDTASLVMLTRRLHTTVRPVEPSAAFRRRLKADLISQTQERQTLLWHWRKLPARVHIATVLAVFGGFGLILVGRLADVMRRQHESKETTASSTVS